MGQLGDSGDRKGVSEWEQRGRSGLCLVQRDKMGRRYQTEARRTEPRWQPALSSDGVGPRKHVDLLLGVWTQGFNKAERPSLWI